MGEDRDKNTDVFVVGKDGAFTKLGKVAGSVELTPEGDFDLGFGITETDLSAEFETEIPFRDLCVKRLIATIIDKRFGSNNWRKLHGLPMWRLR